MTAEPARSVPVRASWATVDWIVLALITVGAALICAAAILRRPDLNASSTFLFADPGVNLLIAEKLAEGGRLFRDAASSYGPLAIYPYAWFTKLVGNTPQSFSVYLGLFSVTSVALAYVFLRRHVRRMTAAIVAVVGLYPTILLPGSLIFGIQASAYIVVERVLLLGVVFLWEPPSARRRSTAAGIGVLLGVWQGVRFGTTFFVGGAIVLVDLLALYFASADRAVFLRWLRVSLVTLGCFLAVQLAWVVWAYALLAPADARDFLWPSYALEAFEVWPSDRRWPRYEDMKLFIGQQLFPLGCIVLGCVVLVQVVRAHRARQAGTASGAGWCIPPEDAVLLLPFLFYMIGAAGLFRSVYHFHQYAWALALTAGLALERGRRVHMLLFVGLAAPAFALMARANLLTRPPADAVAIRPPGGGSLTITPDEKRRVDAIRAYATVPVTRTLIIMTVGAGFHALYDTRDPGRQMFYILAFSRGDDQNTMLRILDSPASAIVLTGYPAGAVPEGDPCSWYGWQHFRRAFCPALAQRLAIARAFRLDETTWVIPSASAADSGQAAPDTTAAMRPGPH